MTTPSPADVAAATAAAATGQQQPPADGGAQGDPAGGGPQFDPNKPVITQSHMNYLLAEEKRKIQARYSDYDELKGKAERFDGLVGTAKTAEEQAADLTGKLTTTEHDLASEKLTTLRQRLAGESNIPVALWNMVGGADEATIKTNIATLKQHLATNGQQEQGDGDGAGKRRGRAPGQGRPADSGGDGGPSGSIESGRELYESRQPKSGKK